MCVITNYQYQRQQGSILLNTMFVLLFFNISFVAILGYSQSLKVDFQRLIQKQQAGQAIFALFEQPPDYLSSRFFDNPKIMTRSLLQLEHCQKIEGYVAESEVHLYYWSCNP